MQTPPVSLELEPYIPTSWRQLQRQIENLAQFGGAVQVITGAEGAGKSTFLEDLLQQASTQQGWEIWQVGDEAWPGQALQKLLEALGLPVVAEQSVGESMVALRKYNQNLQRQKRRVVVAVDNADLLSDATLSGVVSVLQGGAEEGFGLHLVMFARESLADRLDALQLIDVSVYDFVLPCLSLQELTELLNGEYQDLSTRESVRPLSADALHDIWLESQGLPGVALTLAREAWALSMGDEKRFSLRGLPLVHILLVVVLISVLVWAIWMREKPSETAPTITQETTLQSINNKPLTIEMKQVNPGESSEPVKLPSAAPEAVQSPQQALNNYTATQAAPTESAPVPQPAAPVTPPVEEAKPEAVKTVAAKPEVAVKPEPVKEAKPEPSKDTKPASKPA
ncbi:MAG TPA: AAA family ATPase, partial [Cellvibrionaceae bacterium]|nr:AAA family ATPase [Cellvibrionaceae bacterium]